MQIKSVIIHADGNLTVNGDYGVVKGDENCLYPYSEAMALIAEHPELVQPEPLPPPPTPEQLRAAEIASLKAYLDSTDWYVARLAETGTAIPDDVKAVRAAARARIDELRANE